jgi:hypothetical protein
MAVRKRDGTAIRLMDNLLDEIDEERARQLRNDLGRRHWLVSWMLDDDGTWMARVSGPGYPDTVERTGRTRVEAIERATSALRELMPGPEED